MSGSPVPASGPPRWAVVITDWAFNAYLDLKHAQVFDVKEYRTKIRPAVELLRDGIPSPHPQFVNSKFWSAATLNKVPLPGGFKMKWHNIGQGQVQLRLPVAIGNRPVAFLCAAYVKSNQPAERRMLAKFKSHLNLISLGQVVYRGTL